MISGTRISSSSSPSSSVLEDALEDALEEAVEDVLEEDFHTSQSTLLLFGFNDVPGSRYMNIVSSGGKRVTFLVPSTTTRKPWHVSK